jgi:hypothetical protein
MKNKLLVTTALVGSLVASAAVAETKISGDLEQTISGVSYDGSNSQQGTSGMGAEANISLSSSKDLDNGLASKYGFTLEDGTVDSYHLTVGTEAIGVTLANDHGSNTSNTTIPFVSDTFETVVRDNVAGNTTKISYQNHGVGNAHDKAHIALGGKNSGVEYLVRYAPSSQNRASDSDISGSTNKDNGGSVSEALVKGSINGVGFLAGIEKAEKDFNASSVTAEDIKFKTYGLSYNFGQFAVGVTKKEKEDGTAGREDDSIQYGASVALSDNFTAGVYYLENDRNTASEDEEVKMAQVGYNFGGLGLELSYAEAESAGFTAGDDYEIWQLRTKQKF